MSNRRKVLAYAAHLDKIADEIERNFEAYQLSEKQAQEFIHSIDSLSDHMMAAHGINPQALSIHDDVREALVVERNADEPYMDTFGQPSVLEHDADETYVKEHMDDLDDDAFHNPLVDGMGNDKLIHADEDEDMDDDEDDDKEASFDYWNDEPSREAGRSDYWDDTPRESSRRKTDYWD